VTEKSPVIGLSMDTAWYSRLGITSTPYDLALTRVGARTLEVRRGEMEVDKFLDAIDGLLISGGGDVDPALSGASGEGFMVDRLRDDFEIALVRGAIKRDMPVLGVCRGIQLMNVAHGGTLQNLRDDKERNDLHGIDTDSFDAHEVTVRPGSRLSEIGPEGTFRVNSFHGIAVEKVGAGLRASALAEDGLVEAVERPASRFVIGMQWHPEWLSMEEDAHLAIFNAFVEAAAAYRREKPRTGR
jgi:gamma-glutamyl-gamma-aminobutyrate hydrolase PuuD